MANVRAETAQKWGPCEAKMLKHKPWETKNVQNEALESQKCLNMGPWEATNAYKCAFGGQRCSNMGTGMLKLLENRALGKCSKIGIGRPEMMNHGT